MNKAQSTSNKTKQKQANNSAIKIVLIVVGVIVGLIVLASIAISVVSHSSSDKEKQKFTDMASAVQAVGPSLAQAAPNLQGWSFKKACTFDSGTGISPGSWTCAASWTGTLSLADADEAKAMASQLKQSNLFNFRDESDYSKLLDQSSDAQIQHPVYSVQVYENKTNQLCSEDFVNTEANDTIAVNFECSAGSKQSWYPNTETNQYLPGVNAYKD